MTDSPAFWRRSDRVLSLNLSGYLFLVYTDDEQPVLGPMGDTYFLPVFSTKEKLDAYIPVFAPKSPTKIKQITDGKEFVDSIHEGGVRIMVDPYICNGNIRFTMVEQ
jgi:hypothetical protein